MQQRTIALGVLGLVTATLVAGCTGSSGAKSSAAGGAMAVPSPAAGEAAGAARAPVAGGQNKFDAQVTSTALIRTAEMTVAVRDVAAQADRAGALAEQAGGEVDADDRTSGRHATATLRLRVPPNALQPTLTALSRLGTEKSRTLSTTDVTEQVADVNSRVASARESIARLRTLYGSATKVSDVIAIESELSTRESDLESLEAQQRALAAQTSLATITLHLVTVAAPVPPPRHVHHRGGFVGGLERGWDGFTAAAVWVADAVGTLLPFLLLALLVGAGVRLLRPRLPRRSATPPESDPLPG